jgi:transcriptional regulator with XRE-family HTH domain
MNSEEGRVIRERMVQARRDRKLSQEDVAAALNRTRQVVSKWETGRSFPNPREFRDWCIFLGVTPDWALTGMETISADAAELLHKLKTADFEDTRP